MFQRSRIGLAAALAFGSASVLTPSAFAQDNQRVEVTGSNIPRTDKETASPVQVISAKDLQNSGYSTVSEVLRDITANGQGTLSQGFNQAFSAGASGVSLRGLTVGGTLVLIDGLRMAPYPLSDDGQRPFVDISSIPFSAIERIEILKDGASAVYGSDAIAGVVNVILKKKVDGTQLSVERGLTQHGGGSTWNASIMQGFGADNDKLNGYVALEYRKQGEIKLSQRSGEWTNFDWRPLGGVDLRPGASNQFATNPRLATPYLQIPSSDSTVASNFAFYPGCTHADMRASACAFQNTWAQLQPNTENLNLIGRINSKLSEDWSLNLTASYFQSKSQQVRSPSNIPFSTFAGVTAIGPGISPVVVGTSLPFNVPATYPGNTLGVPAGIRGYLMLNGLAPRVDDIESDSTRLVAEVDGNAMGWDLKGAVGFTRVVTKRVSTGYINFPNLSAALQDTANPYRVSGGNTQAMLNLVSPTVNNTATDSLHFAGIRGSRELGKLDGGPLGIAAGLDVRYKRLNAPDPVENQLGTMNVSSAYALGTETATSAFVEVVAPVMKGLELDGALRFDHYNTYGNSTTPKVGFKFTPNKAFALRGTASAGFRAPSATENGTAGSIFSFNAIRDPILCAVNGADGKPDLKAAANVPAQCSFTPSYLQGTTKDIKPEKSKSYTLGIILEPITNLSTTLDYYSIKVTDQIIPAAALATFNPLDFIVRTTPQQVTFGDGSTGLSSIGPIQYVNTPYVNGQTTETSGIELDARYKFAVPDVGDFTVGFQFTHMINYDLTVNGKTFKLAGTHGPAIISGDTGNPKDRMQLSLAYARGPLSVTATANYIGSYDVTDPSNGLSDCASGITAFNAQFQNGTTPPEQFCRIRPFTTVNLSAQYKVSKNLTLRGAIVNLFDKAPPVDLQTYGGTGANASSSGTGAAYNPSLHQTGAVGRMFSVGVDYKF